MKFPVLTFLILSSSLLFFACKKEEKIINENDIIFMSMPHLRAKLESANSLIHWIAMKVN